MGECSLSEIRDIQRTEIRNVGQMTTPTRTVAVKRLPGKFGGKQGRTFRRELAACLNVDRPWVVLDCSNLRQLDPSYVHLMLCSLEEALKRNGDVKLVAIPPGADAILELAGVKRLFDIFATADDAVNSFHQPSVGATSEGIVPEVLASPAGKSSVAGLRWSFWHAQSVGGFEEN
jgi:anti-sigma B factor antagonist